MTDTPPDPAPLDLSRIRRNAERILKRAEQLDGKPFGSPHPRNNTQWQKDRNREMSQIRRDLDYLSYLAKDISTDVDAIYFDSWGYPID